jgi:hypothetical protein
MFRAHLDMAGQERRQMLCHADRPDTAAAAMRDTEGLMQVHVADIGADVAWPRQADERI